MQGAEERALASLRLEGNAAGDSSLVIRASNWNGVISGEIMVDTPLGLSYIWLLTNEFDNDR
jgi:hypothetical protein